MAGLLDQGGLLGNQDALLALAAGLLSGKKGQTGATIGESLMGALRAGTLSQENQRRNASQDLQNQQMQMHLDQLRQQQATQNQIQQAWQKNMAPGIPQMLPTDQETPTGPAAPPTLNMGGLRQSLMSMGPAALPFLGQLASMDQKEILKLRKDEVAYQRNPDGSLKQVATGVADLPAGMRMGTNNQPEWIPGYIQGQSDIRNAGKPTVEVRLNNFTPASEEAQKEFMKSTRSTYDQLKSAPVALANIEKAKQLVPKARVFMGPGGNATLEAAKFLNNRMGMNIRMEGVKSAEELRTRIFQNVMDNLKKMDAQPSEMQQRIMQDALGRLETDPNALPQVLDAFGDSIKGKVQVHNQEVQGAMQRGVKFPYDPTINIDSPAQGPLKKNLTATFKAKQAIQSGADPVAVRQRLRESGYDDSGL